MRRVVTALALCAIGGGALAGTAAATPKPQVYEFCGSFSGCLGVLDLYRNTMTWEESEGPSKGTYTTGPKGLLVLTVTGPGCTIELHKVKKSKNYAGAETGGGECLTQTVELIRLKGKPRKH